MRNLVLLLGLLACVGSTAARARDWEIAERPAWVTEVAWEGPATLPDDPPSGGGVQYLLFDLQMNPLGRPATYYRTVKTFVDQAGVETGAEIRIDFDALYQNVVVHAIRIHRDGRALDRLPSASFDVIRQESSRGEEFYQATRSIRAYVKDVRVGDVLEHAYTTHGANPVFGDHVVDGLSLGWPVPVGRVYRSILWPADRPLYLLPRRTDRQPDVRREGDLLRYVWDAHDTPATVVDDALPAWYDPMPWVQISTFASWADVVRWGLDLYPLSEPAPAEMIRLVHERAGPDADASRRVEAALRLVQDEIRYLYIGLAESSHRPSAPADVLERRFGDCKDKSLLLVTLLRALGVDAAPALVSTDWREHIEQLHPSPLAFDHVIVRASVDGRSYWLDPTVTHQRGRLQDLAVPLWGRALVLEPGSDALEPIPLPDRGEPDTDILARYELGDGTAAVDLRVRTTYRGREADDVRVTLRTTTPEELQKSYVQFYADAFPSIEASAPVTWEDVEDPNVVHVQESYRIPGFWETDESGAWYEGVLYPLELDWRLQRSYGAARTMPLGIAYPDHVRIVTEARTLDGWSIDTEEQTIEDPAFRFDYRVEVEGAVLRVTQQYRSRADHVSPEAMTEHLSNVQEAAGLVAFPIQLPIGLAGGTEFSLNRVNWPVASIGLLVAVGTVVLAVRVYRWTPPPLPVDPDRIDRAKAGLGGWLVLVAIGLLFSSFRILWDLSSALPTYALPMWNSLTVPGATAYDPLWAPVLIGELVINITFFVWSVLLLALYFSRRTAFPRVFVAFLVVTPLALIVDTVLAGKIAGVGPEPGETRALAGQALRSLIWIAYTLRSTRVRKTFVRGPEQPVESSGRPQAPGSSALQLNC